MNYDEALSYIKTGESLLFLGSGFSLNAKNRDGEEIPSVTKLTMKMITAINDDINIPPNEKIKLVDKHGQDKFFDFSTIASYFIKKLGKKSFYNFLKKQFVIDYYTESQKTIVNNPWLSIFTTNYDDIVEKISGKTSVSESSDNLSEVDEQDSVIHVNGSIQNIRYSTVDFDLTLTNDSYLKNKFASSSLGASLSSLVKEAKAIFFVGFSFSSDLDIARLYLATNSWDKTFFIDGEMEMEEVERISDFGSVTQRDSESFARDIAAQPLVSNKKSASLSNIRAFKKVQGDFNKIKNSDVPRLLTQLIINCDLDEKYVLDDEYIIPRSSENTQSIITNLNKYRLLVVSSKLGNGKTVFMHWLSNYLAKQYNVWSFNSANIEKFSSDIRAIKSQESEPIIFIDDIYKLQEYFKDFKSMSKDMTFIVSGRSSILEHTMPVLKRHGKFDDSEICYLQSLDHISDSDLKLFQHNIEVNNLWGNIDQSKVLRNSSFSRILVEYYKASGILQKHFDLFKDEGYIREDEKRVIICILLLNSVADQLTLDDILKSLDIIVDERMRNSLLLEEYIDFKYNRILLKGSVLSKELLGNDSIFGIEEILNVVCRIFGYFDNANKRLNRFWETKKNLVSFSNLQLLLHNYSINNQPEFNENIGNYYYKIQNMRFCKENPFFWIQYAKSCNFAKKFDVALVYVGNARKFAKHALEDKYQIDSTEINIYVSSAEEVIEKDFSKFITNLTRSVKLSYNVETAYVISLFGKLGSESMLNKYQHLSNNHKSEIYNSIVDIKNMLLLRDGRKKTLSPNEKINLKKIYKILEITNIQSV